MLELQVGTLVKWEDGDGNTEYGIVVELSSGAIEDRVLVFFPEDDGNSFISVDELEVICE